MSTLLMPDNTPMSLDLHRDMSHTGLKMPVFRDEHGHFYPRDEEFELQPGLEPGFTTDGKDFESAGEIIRKVGSIIGIPTIETDVHGNPLDAAVAGLEGGFDDDRNPASRAAKRRVAERNKPIDGGQSAEQLV